MADLTGGASGTMATWTPEVWSKRASITYRAAVVLPPLLDHTWEPELVRGLGDTAHIPQFTQNATSTSRSTFGTGAALTWSAVTESQTDLVVIRMRTKAFRIPVEGMFQMMPNYLTYLTDGIGTAIAVDTDADIAADNTDGFDGLTAIGADNVDVTEDDILTAEAVLNNANAPLKDRFFVFSPNTYNSLRKIEALRNQLYNASGTIDLAAGPGACGHIFTLNCFLSNNLEAGTAGKKNAIFQREAIAYAAQVELKVLHDVNIEDGIFDQYVGYNIYGFKMVKSGSGREVDGK